MLSLFSGWMVTSHLESNRCYAPAAGQLDENLVKPDTFGETSLVNEYSLHSPFSSLCEGSSVRRHVAKT
jgi:hypothetical protein